VSVNRRAERARENSEYVRKLLSERQPGFLAMLQSAVRQVDSELSQARQDRRTQPGSQEPAWMHCQLHAPS
jgi:hypothetical protein